jgi:hypothetical protein
LDAADLAATGVDSDVSTINFDVPYLRHLVRSPHFRSRLHVH